MQISLIMKNNIISLFFLRACALIWHSLKQSETVYYRIYLLYLVFKIFVLVKMLKSNHVSLFGVAVRTGNPEYFLYTFCEVFVFEIYKFNFGKKKAHIYDCGANVGLVMIYFKLKYPLSSIICFEPEPHAFDCLRQNVVNNDFKGVMLHQSALSGQTEELPFFVNSSSPGDPHSNMSSVCAGCVDQILVHAVKLSDKVFERISLLKLDVEGSELEIISDLSETGKLELIDQIVLEMHPNDECQLLSKVLLDNGFIVKKRYWFNNRYDGNYFLHARNKIRDEIS